MSGIIVNFVKNITMTEIIFIIEESPEGGYEAKALWHSIFTEGETIEELKENIKEAIHCHFEVDAPKIIRLHYVKEEVIAA
jgi:predicted RNase H-like HicB family nuclease